MKYKNDFIICKDVVKVKINSPKYGIIYTLIDLEDLPLLLNYKLRVKYDKTINNFYIYTGRMLDNKWCIKALHRIITDCPDNLQVDHISRDPLDNRKCNLRICTCKENVHNQGVRITNKVGVTGISYNSKTNKYTARTPLINGKRKYIGSYNTAEEAIFALEGGDANAL